MKKFMISVLTLAICISPFTTHVSAEEVKDPIIEITEPSKVILKDVFTLLKENNAKSESEKIELLSGYFLDTPYVANRLVGSPTEPEQLVIALSELDCFTFLDYIESFKRSQNEEEFIKNLEKVRYIDSKVEYYNRKHFYSDWYSENEKVAEDLLTKPEFSEFVETDVVNLNEAKDGGTYIPNLPLRERNINYIPRDKVTNVLPLLKTGDYIGIRKNIQGLDVTHTGIVIVKEDGVYMRHASSSKSTMKVVDQKITDYLDINTSVKGLLFFRSNATMQPIQGTLNIEFKDEAGNTVHPTQVVKKNYGETYDVAAPSIPGYTYLSAKDNKGIVADENTITFTYRYVSEEFEIQFDDTSKKMMEDVFTLLKQNNLKSDAEKLELISGYFLETPYVANRLVGSTTDPEQLVIALNELDCFTFLDYIESFKQSNSQEDFINNLKRVRYREAKVEYLHRKHFYSDWYTESQIVATDLLTLPEYANIIQTDSVDLNQGANGVYIPGLAVRNRDINFIPRANINADVLKTFKTGDYVGIRKNIAGLDVTHTGIIIQKEDGTYMRHASSSKSAMKVVDQKLTDYLDINTSVAGLLFFRSNSEFKPFMSTVTTKFVDENGTELKSQEILDVKLMDTYKVEAPVIDGYTLTGNNVLEGTVETDSLELVFNYKKTSTTTPDKEKPEEKLPSTGIDSKQPLMIAMTLILVGLAVITINKFRKEN
ncbi:MAG: DUF1460 domain-containing protein [Erysipelothrix sp.]